jgi:TetR/AcrR family transcriptional repressor of nem operon
MADRDDADTPTRILDAAEALVQRRGYNAFSYADVAAELGITKPALHYHFANKAALGEALVARYAERFNDALAAIGGSDLDGRAKLEAYVDLYRGVLVEGRLCLCGMLAADFATLPPAVRDGVIRFFDDNDVWLAEVLDQGAGDGTLRITGSSRDAARMVIGALEGAMLVARPYGDVDRFDAAAARLVADLTPDRPATSEKATDRRR